MKTSIFCHNVPNVVMDVIHNITKYIYVNHYRFNNLIHGVITLVMLPDAMSCDKYEIKPAMRGYTNVNRH